MDFRPPNMYHHSIARLFFVLALAALLCVLLFSLSPSAQRWPWPFLSSSSSSSSSSHLYSSLSLSYGPMRLCTAVQEPLPDRLLEVPQIVWGLNNQKIAIARAALTARYLNRTLLLPSLTASLFPKDGEKPLRFDQLFSLPEFNSRCNGFVSIAACAQLPVRPVHVTRGSGRRWTRTRDAAFLDDCRKNPDIGRHPLLKILGKHPFLWPDHWPTHEYARVFQCLTLIPSLSSEVDRVVSAIQQTGPSNHHPPLPFIAAHMRIEKDWAIHCKKTENRAISRFNLTLNICVTKDEIANRIAHIPSLTNPTALYLAVANTLLDDQNSSLLRNWSPRFVPYDKNRLHVSSLYQKHPYLVQSAIDYEVCLRADIFVGNSFSTFSSLIVLDRTMKSLRKNPLTGKCAEKLPSYAYNLVTPNGGPQPWFANLSDTSLDAISYGTNTVLHRLTQDSSDGCGTDLSGF